MDKRKFTSTTITNIPRRAWRIIKSNMGIDYEGTMNEFIVEKIIIPYAEQLGYKKEEDK